MMIGEKVVQWILLISEFPPLDTQYHNQCMKKLYYHPKVKLTFNFQRKLNPQFSTDIEQAIQCIYSYLENLEECQFSMNDLLKQIEGDYRPDYCQATLSRSTEKVY